MKFSTLIILFTITIIISSCIVPGKKKKEKANECTHGELQTRNMYEEQYSANCKFEIQKRTCLLGSWGDWNGKNTFESCVPKNNNTELIAGFNANIFKGDSPLKVEFTSSSTGDIQTYEWDFDDDGKIDSTLKNPTYTYYNEGEYSVKLVIKGNLGKSLHVRPNLIHVTSTTIAPTPTVIPTVIPTVTPALTWEEEQEIKFNKLPTVDVDVLADNFINLSQSDYDGDADYSQVDINDQPFNKAIEVDVKTLASADYRINMTLNSPKALKQDDLILMSFYARFIPKAQSINDYGQMEFLFQRGSKPWTEYISWPLKITNKWKKYYIPVAVNVYRDLVSPPNGYDDSTFAPEEVRFRLSLGYHPQKLQIADLNITNYKQQISGDQLPNSRVLESNQSIFVNTSIDTSTPIKPWTPQIIGDAKSKLKYLPDFGYAGYHFGENKLPSSNNGVVIDITHYGAIANDGKDDTQAIHRAISAAEQITNYSVILKFPSGKFIISEIITIKRDNIIMKGEGSNQNKGTTLYFTKPMEEMSKPQEILEIEQDNINSNRKTDDGSYYSPFSWTGGVIWVKPNQSVPAATLATVTSSSKRGDHKVTVNNVSQLSVGKTIQFRYYKHIDDTNSIREHVFNCTSDDLPDGFGQSLPPAWSNGPDVWQAMTITSINGNEVVFKGPLNHDIRESWQGQLRDIGFVKEVGIEGFKIEFPPSNYKGHHLEDGYNAIYLSKAINSWVKDIHISNVDSGIIVSNSKNVTIADIFIDGRGGHYSLMTGSSDQILFKNFAIKSRTLHTISFNTYNRTSVYSHGTVDSPRLDQHNGMNHQNLFDDLTFTGDVGHLWDHGGNNKVRPTHGAFNTSWNFQFLPSQNVAAHATNILDGPSAYMIGFTSKAPLMFEYGPSVYTEGMGQKGITIPSLYEFQLNERIK